MRITHQMTANNAIRNMSDNLEKLSHYQARAGSGKTFQAVSDQPDAAGQALKLRSRLQTLAGYHDTTSQAKEWLDANEMALQGLEDLATSAASAITRGLNATFSADERAGAMATEMDNLLARALAVGNSSHKGQYLFSGYQTGTQPFSQPDPNTVLYSGDRNQITVRVGPAETLAVNFDGDSLLSPLLNQLIAARNAFSANDLTALRGSLAQIQSSLANITEAHAENGVRARQAQAADSRLNDSLYEVERMLANREDVDLAEAVTLLRNQETTYQAVLEVSQRAISALNLFEYLR